MFTFVYYRDYFSAFYRVFCSTEESTIMDYGGKLAYDND